MQEITISAELMINNENTKTLKFNFEKITGRQIMSAEKKARMLGDNTPAIVFSMTYQAILASIATGANLDDILELPGQDLLDILAIVNDFLFSRA